MGLQVGCAGARPATGISRRSRRKASLWDVPGLRGAAKLSATLQEHMDLAVLFRIVATVDRDVPVGVPSTTGEWNGPTDAFADRVRRRLGGPALAERVSAVARVTFL